MSRARKIMEDIDIIDTPSRENKIKQEFRNRLEFFEIDGVYVEDVVIQGNDILVSLYDYEDNQLDLFFVVDPEEGAIVLIADDEDEETDVMGWDAIIDLEPAGAPIQKTLTGEMIKLDDLQWMNKSILTALLLAGDMEPDDEMCYEPAYQMDAYGNRFYLESLEKIKEEGEVIEERFAVAIRGGKRQKIAIKRKKIRRKTAAQRAGYKKAARKLRITAKRADVQRKRKKSLKLRKRLGVKTPKLKGREYVGK